PPIIVTATGISTPAVPLTVVVISTRSATAPTPVVVIAHKASALVTFRHVRVPRHDFLLICHEVPQLRPSIAAPSGQRCHAGTNAPAQSGGINPGRRGLGEKAASRLLFAFDYFFD